MSERYGLLLRSKIADWILVLTALNEGLGSKTLENIIKAMKKEELDNE